LQDIYGLVYSFEQGWSLLNPLEPLSEVPSHIRKYETNVEMFGRDKRASLLRQHVNYLPESSISFSFVLLSLSILLSSFSFCSHFLFLLYRSGLMFRCPCSKTFNGRNLRMIAIS
jgi:hypothetical protein